MAAGKQGEANITLSATDQTKVAIESAKRNLAQLGDAAALLPMKFGTIGTAIAAAFGGATLKSTIDVLDKMDDMSEKTGVAVDKLSALRYAGEVNGTTFEALGTGLRKLSQGMADAAGGGKEAQEVFKTIGVSVNDASGKLRGADAVLLDIANKFASYEDSAGKAALAQQIFGKSGLDMIPLLNQGADGISKLAKEGRDLGAVYGGELAKAAADFNDNLKKFELMSEGVKASLLNDLLGPLNKILDTYLKLRQMGDLGVILKDAGLAFFGQGRMTGNATADLEKVRAEREKVLADQAKSFGDTSIFGKLFGKRDFKAEIEQLDGYIRVLEMLEKRDAPAGAAGTPGSKKKAPVVAKPGDSSADTYIASLTTQMAGLTGQASKTDEVITHLAINSDKFTVSQKAEALTIADAIDRMNEMTKAAEQAARAKSAEIDAIEKSTEVYHNAISAMEQAGEAQRIEAENIGKLAPAIEKARFEREQAKRVREAESALVSRGILEGWDEIRMEEERARVTKMAADEASNFAKVQADQFDKTYNASRGVSEAMKDYAETASQHGKNAADAVGRVMGSVEDGLTDLLTKGQFNVKALVDMMISEFTRLQVVRPMMAGLFGAEGIGASILSSIFGTPAKKAGGGTLTPGMPTLVGENGPELIYPMSAGHVVPNSQIGGGGVVVNVIEAPGQGGTQQRSTDSSGNDVITVFVERVKAAVASDILRGNGAVPSALASTYGLNRAAGAY